MKATIWRGPEYSWKSGDLFYKKGQADNISSQVIYEITKDDKTDYISVDDPKEKYISTLKITRDTMNSEMAYVNSGNLVRPDTLKRLLGNASYNHIILYGLNPFTTDTTQKTVNVKGEIVGIKNGELIFFISSKVTEKNGR